MAQMDDTKSKADIDAIKALVNNSTQNSLKRKAPSYENEQGPLTAEEAKKLSGTFSKRPKLTPSSRRNRKAKQKSNSHSNATEHQGQVARTSGFLSLPLELKQQIFSYGSARDTARLKRVCKEFNSDISGSTEYLEDAYAGRELARLQEGVVEFVNLRTPTDANSMMEALHVWTKRRGMFADHKGLHRSLFKLLAHLFMGMQGYTRGKMYDALLTWMWAADGAMLEHQGRSWRSDPETWDGITSLGIIDDDEMDKLIR